MSAKEFPRCYLQMAQLTWSTRCSSSDWGGFRVTQSFYQLSYSSKISIICTFILSFRILPIGVNVWAASPCMIITSSACSCRFAFTVAAASLSGLCPCDYDCHSVTRIRFTFATGSCYQEEPSRRLVLCPTLWSLSVLEWVNKQTQLLTPCAVSQCIRIFD